MIVGGIRKVASEIKKILGGKTLSEALAEKLDKNTTITGATKTKITYDADGLITAGENATTADIADSADKRYCLESEKTILQNQITMASVKACVSLADDATIALPATPNGGLLQAWTEAEYMEVHIRADGSIEYIRKTANCDVADTDGKLCVYDGGSNAIIKNRLASTKIVTYVLEYGTTT